MRHPTPEQLARLCNTNPFEEEELPVPRNPWGPLVLIMGFMVGLIAVTLAIAVFVLPE